MTVTTKVAVIGAQGFIGRNLLLRLAEQPRFGVSSLTRASSAADWRAAIGDSDVVVNLAGVNRPPDEACFRGNYEVVDRLADAIGDDRRSLPVIHLSSAKATDDTPYGRSKKLAEDRLLALAGRTGGPVALLRLPNVFGKWSRPNYNSAVATFCHNLARDLPIRVDDPASPLDLIYIDDLIDGLLALIDGRIATGFHDVGPIYCTDVGTVAATIRGFRTDRADNLIANVGHGLTRALYATYVSYLPPAEFAYPVVAHTDPRGSFSEMLKTRDAGQFSFFTAHPGVTRGGHYHHSKTEKFLIVHGRALFRFRHMLTGETHEVRTDADAPTVVETVPGWTHDVTNVGEGVMVAMLWANELFDRDRPDTIAEKV
jgi:UDP-2-acetamido-2,6-beta-L-arabino-hexul-4-ose reductase